MEEEIAAEEMLELALTDLINWLDPQDILPHLGMSYEENPARC